MLCTFGDSVNPPPLTFYITELLHDACRGYWHVSAFKVKFRSQEDRVLLMTPIEATSQNVSFQR